MDNQGYVQNEKVDRRLSLAGMELPGPVRYAPSLGIFLRVLFQCLMLSLVFSRRNSRAPPPYVPEVPKYRADRRLSLSGMEIPGPVRYTVLSVYRNLTSFI